MWRGSGFERVGRLIACAVVLGCWASPALTADPQVAAANRGVVELETDGSAGVSIRIAEELANLVDDGATRRVLPVVGRTARQNLLDLLQLRGIDMAILQIDVLDSLRQQRGLPSVETGFTYITKLYNQEFHLLAGPGIKTAADLSHKRVNIGPTGSGTSVTAERLFALLKIPVEAVNDRSELGLDQLRHGEIAAIALVAGKPAALLQSVQRDEGLHFVALPMDAGVINAYVPTSLNADDYPGLVAPDQPVETVAVGTILAVANLQPASERYKNVATFVETFFTQFRSLLEPGHHPKWRDINLAAELPGWTRFPPAQQWLARNTVVAKPNSQDLQTLFSRFLDTRQRVLGGAPVTEQQKQDLFNEFQSWQSGRAR